jgi:hypothetical protein
MKKNIYSYNLIKKENEIQLFFDIRKIFIELSKPINKKEFELINMYSNILINILFLKCRYEKKTEKFIKEIIHKNKDLFFRNISNNIVYSP